MADVEMVPVCDVRVGDRIVLDDGGELLVVDMAGTRFRLFAFDGASSPPIRVPSNAVLAVRRAPRKWRRTVVIEFDHKPTDVRRVGGPLWDGTVVSDTVEEVEQ